MSDIDTWAIEALDHATVEALHHLART